MSPTEASRQRIFFRAMSVLLATIVCYGFAPSYSRRPSDAPSIPVYLHAHGIAMTMQGAAVPKPALMIPGELEKLPARPPDHRIAYGNDTNQFGELRVPAGRGPHPVAVLVHGGCWKAEYATLRDLASMGDALEDAGIASWNIEYRRLRQDGSGWPGTYRDIGAAIEHVRSRRNMPLT